jgi:hypothetical protein
MLDEHLKDSLVDLAQFGKIRKHFICYQMKTPGFSTDMNFFLETDQFIPLFHQYLFES